MSRKKHVLPLIFGVSLFLALIFTPPFQVTASGVGLTIVSCLVTLVGVVCRFFAIRNIQYNLEERTSECGIYSLVRFPKYLSALLIMLGISIYAGVVWFIFIYIAVAVIVLERVILFEDGVAVKRYGEVYLQWCTRTNAIIPLIKPFTPIIYKGRFFGVAQKESLIALLLVVGYSLINFLKSKMLHFEWSLDLFWVVMLIITTILTVIFNLKRIFSGSHK